MNKTRILTKAVAMTVFLIMGFLNSAEAKTKKTSLFPTPDFAYPKTVETESKAALSSALKRGDAIKTLRELINLTISRDLISNENAEANTALIDSVSQLLEAPYSAIGFLVEAQLYSDIYNRDRYTFDQRNVTAEMAEGNPEFWDKKIFERKIDQLTQEALLQRRSAEPLSLSVIEPLIDEMDGMDTFTVYDFIVYKTIELKNNFRQTEIIPFFKSAPGTYSPVELVDQLISIHHSGLPLVTAIVRKFSLLDGENRGKYLWNEIERFKDQPEAAALITVFYSYYGDAMAMQPAKQSVSLNNSVAANLPVSEKDFYKLVKSLQHTFKTKTEKEYIQSTLDAMEAPSVNLNFPSTVMTATPFEVKATAQNLNRFYLLVAQALNPEQKSYKKSELLSNIIIKETREITLKEEIPFKTDSTINVEITNPGQYVLLVSKSPNPQGILIADNYIYPSYINVSDIDIFTLSNEGCFIVNSSDGAPIENAEVEFSSRYYNDKWNKDLKTEKAYTDENGFASSFMNNPQIRAEFKSSEAFSNLYNYSEPSEEKPKTKFKIFTDRKTYRPGDQVQFMAIAYEEYQNSGNLLPGQRLKVELCNTNRETTDEKNLTADNSGRVFGSFTIPKDGLLGLYYIEIDNYKEYFNVAEYKVPSFLIKLEKEAAKNDSITFGGTVASYSGMPLGNVKVDYKVKYIPGRFYFFHTPDQEYTGHTVSDEDGNFHIILPIDNLNADAYRGIFTITASATDKAGETAYSNMETFYLRNSYFLTPEISSRNCIDSDTLTLKVGVSDALGLPVVRKVEYRIYNSQNIEVSKDYFESPLLKLSTSSLPSGQYRFEFNIPGEEVGTQEISTIFYRTTDTTPPIETALWVPLTEIVVPAGEKLANVAYGSSFENQNIYCVLGNSDGSMSGEWLTPSKGMKTLAIPAPKENERAFITLVAYRNHVAEKQTITVIPQVQKQHLEIETETFRSSLTDGEQETWKFRLNYDSQGVGGYAYALLYDKAMDAIEPLDWNSNILYPSYSNPINLTTAGYTYSVGYFRDGYKIAKTFSNPIFEFDTYGYPLYAGSRYYLHTVKRMASYSRSMKAEFSDDSYRGSNEVMMEDAVYDAPAAEFAVTTEGAAVANQASREKALRPIELPVAFFMPDLTSSKEGEIEISFTVPDFNTTWKFLLGAYTPRLQTAQIALEAVASKKVMVKMLAPRFLRTGDNATINATIYNNTGREEEIYGVLEIFNPYTGETLQSHESHPEKTKPSGNRIVSIQFNCPTDLNCIGVRAYGKSGLSSDGEQTLIPILPSSQPIVESIPFYLAPDVQEYTIEVPREKEGARVTFTYCDNPTWEMLTALPSLSKPQDQSVTSLAAAYYANSVGYGLLSRHANLSKGLKMMLAGEAGDSALVSRLERDSNLKTLTLNNTPWVNNARSETLRMSSLGELLDSVSATSVIADLLEQILLLQSADGGWSWCPHMQPALWPTQSVLQNIGMLLQEDYLQDNQKAKKAWRNGIKYCDNQYVENFRKYGDNKEGFYRSMQQYLYVRSLFPEASASSAFASLKSGAIKYLQNNWKQFSIFDKATLAVTMWREGKKASAEAILESLRQYASESPEKGAWFDNLGASSYGADKLMTTARALRAFSEIKPDDSMVDKLRQWLLQQRQVQDFSDGLMSVDVIDAVLTSGSEWTGEYPVPEISIMGEPVKISEITALTGECKVDVDINEYGEGVIEIHRFSPTPVWGGIISQYVAPMLDVKENSIPQLSIRKEYWKLEESAEGTQAVRTNEMKVGDKVRVALIIESDRDMDYVALTDNRAACLEPESQLSAYKSIDGIMCYQETRNSSTNIFFGFLPKGRHVVTYECRIMEEGEFTSGIATIQSQYAPSLSAHSAGEFLIVKE